MTHVESETHPVILGTRGYRVALGFVNYTLLTLLAIFFIFPLLFMFVASFKPEHDIFSDAAGIVWAFIPRTVSLENYDAVFRRAPFLRYLFNSVLVTGITVGCGLIVNSMIAFALARLRWIGKEAILPIIVALIIVPLEAISIPLLEVVNMLPWVDGSVGWLNSYRVQIIPFISDAFSIFLFYQYFIGIPKEFDEAATIDGASPFHIYWRIIVPLSKPIFSAAAIIQTLWIWNSYLWPLVTTRSEAYRPLSIGVTAFYVQNLQWGHIFAFATMATLPVLALFVLFQKGFIRSVASAGVKG